MQPAQSFRSICSGVYMSQNNANNNTNNNNNNSSQTLRIAKQPLTISSANSTFTNFNKRKEDNSLDITPKSHNLNLNAGSSNPYM